MKIYSKVVIDMFTGETIEEDSFDYVGPLCLCGGGGTSIEAAQPSAAEQQYYTLMNNNIMQNQALTEKMAPLLEKSMGIKQVSPTAVDPADEARIRQLESDIAAQDAKGGEWSAEELAAQKARLSEKSALDNKYASSYAQMSDQEYYDSLSPANKSLYDIQKLQSDRQLKALKGELDVDPALEKQIAQEYSKMSESLSQRLGQGWETSTPGIQALDSFNQRAELLRAAQRKDEMTTGQASLLNTMGFLNNDQSNMSARYSNYAQTPIASMGAISTALQPYQQYASMNNQNNIANAQSSSARESGLMSGIGSLTGMALGGLTGGGAGSMGAMLATKLLGG
jgi:hypothetical protein